MQVPSELSDQRGFNDRNSLPVSPTRAHLANYRRGYSQLLLVVTGMQENAMDDDILQVWTTSICWDDYVWSIWTERNPPWSGNWAATHILSIDDNNNNKKAELIDAD